MNPAYHRWVELRQLRYLVAIADHENLGRAARSLYLTQPALSYALKGLESRLGVRLFDRHPAGVAPTPAGVEVVRQARRVLSEADRLTGIADRYRQPVGELRIGFEASGAGDLAARVYAEHGRREPGTRLALKRYDWGGEAAALRAGEVDVAFVWQPADLTGLAYRLVACRPRVVGMAAGHRLAESDVLSLSDVANEPLMWTRQAPREWVDWWAVNPRPDGSAPVWGATNDNVEEMLDMVAAGSGICFAPEDLARYYDRPGLEWRPLSDADPLHIVVAWRVGETRDSVSRFTALPSLGGAVVCRHD